MVGMAQGVEQGVFVVLAGALPGLVAVIEAGGCPVQQTKLSLRKPRNSVPERSRSSSSVAAYRCIHFVGPRSASS